MPKTILQVNDTELGAARLKYQPKEPRILANLSKLEWERGGKTSCVGQPVRVAKAFPKTFGRPLMTLKPSSQVKKHPTPLRIGLVLSGGPAAGGHNVIAGFFDGCKRINKDSTVIGFLGGPMGVMKNRSMVVTGTILDKYRNTGGFDMLGTGRDKISTTEHMEMSLATVEKHNLDGLVIIGGDDSNTNAAVLAEFFASKNAKCICIGIPKTIDGDLQNEYIEISFGYDTATKVYSGLISNIARDAASALKTWHFVKLMGRDASHVTLECGLHTRPNICLIGEEWAQEAVLLPDIVNYICDVIQARAEDGKNYGVILIPEGLLSFIPSMSLLFEKLGDIMGIDEHRIKIEDFKEYSDKIAYVRGLLNPTLQGNYDILPRDVKVQLMGERDAHGNMNLSKIPTESLLINTVEQELQRRKKAGEYNGKFRSMPHFFGYDGRCAYPTNFDANYCYALGITGSLLIRDRMNGYMSRVFNLNLAPEEWGAGGVPITMLLNYEKRNHKWKPVIKKALVDCDGDVYRQFYSRREDWALQDVYKACGSIQYYGPPSICDTAPPSIYIKKKCSPKL